MVPYLVQAIGEGVSGGLKDLRRLRLLLGAVAALLANPTLDVAPYLHQLLPPVLTCLVARRLGVSKMEGGLSLRPETMMNWQTDVNGMRWRQTREIQGIL